MSKLHINMKDFMTNSLRNYSLKFSQRGKAPDFPCLLLILMFSVLSKNELLNCYLSLETSPSSLDKRVILLCSLYFFVVSKYSLVLKFYIM